jgi:hypothetical protein
MRICPNFARLASGAAVGRKDDARAAYTKALTLAAQLQPPDRTANM